MLATDQIFLLLHVHTWLVRPVRQVQREWAERARLYNGQPAPQPKRPKPNGGGGAKRGQRSEPGQRDLTAFFG